MNKFYDVYNKIIRECNLKLEEVEEEKEEEKKEEGEVVTDIEGGKDNSEDENSSEKPEKDGKPEKDEKPEKDDKKDKDPKAVLDNMSKQETKALKEEINTVFGKDKSNDYSSFVENLASCSLQDEKFKAFIQYLLKLKTTDKTQDFKAEPDAAFLVKKLTPTQNEIDVTKSLHYPIEVQDCNIAMLFPKGNTPVHIADKSIITLNGKYIIDGHHRWSQLYCVNPQAKIAAINITTNNEKFDDPTEFLKLTQILIAANDKIKSNDTKGSKYNIYAMEEPAVREYINDHLVYPGEGGSWETNRIKDFKKYLKVKDRDGIVDKLTANAMSLKTNPDAQPSSDAPPRNVMPQTDHVTELLKVPQLDTIEDSDAMAEFKKIAPDVAAESKSPTISNFTKIYSEIINRK